MSELRKTFDASLKTLKEDLLLMFEAVNDSYKKMFNALKTMDKSLANEIIEEDKKINAMENAINQAVYLVILKQCPVAKDLRFMLSAVKIANDLERIADYATNGAMYILKTFNVESAYNEEILKYKKELLHMLDLVKDSYQDNNISKAFEVSERDTIIDSLYQNQLDEFVNVAKSMTDTKAEEASRALLIIKQLERAGDHITNIAEQIVYLHGGKILDLN